VRYELMKPLEIPQRDTEEKDDQSSEAREEAGRRRR